MIPKIFPAIACWLLAIVAWQSFDRQTCFGHDQVPGAPQTRPILIRGATVHPVDAATLDRGDVLFVEGKITAVGRDIDVPDDAQIIDGDGSHVYPGLFESMTDLGLREISAVDETVDRTEFGSENPNVRSWVAVNPDSELIPVARAGGLLIANVAPGGRWIRGQSAVMQLDGWTADEMNLSAPSGLCVDWNNMTPGGDDDAATVKKREEKLKELDDRLDEAVRYARARRAARDAGELDSFDTDLKLESLLPVIQGQMPMIAQADRQATMQSAVAYAQSRGIKLVIYGGYDAEDCADLLLAHDVPVIVAGTYRLPLRRSDSYDASYTLPARLQAKGVKFSICGEGPGYPGGASQARNLPYHAGCAVAYGLDRDLAVRSITLSPAEILGVADRVGSLTVGKDATLIVATGDILETSSNVTAAFIQGRRVDLGSRHTMLYEKYKRKYQTQSESSDD